MNPLRVERLDRVHKVILGYGANALDDTLLAALAEALGVLEEEGAPALVLASDHPRVFCPGLDLIKLDGRSRTEIGALMIQFNALLRRLATYPGPTVAALTGHAIAGGCLIAMTCDRRVMARSGARLGLSEVNLGIPVPAGSVRMLLSLYTTRAVEQLVLEGDGFGGERALELGLIERLADGEAVVEEACRIAAHLASRPSGAYATAKRFLRQDLAKQMEAADAAELERFLDHWFEPGTQDRIGALVAAMTR